MNTSDFSFDPSSFDILPWPVVIVNRQGKIVYKNKFSYKLKLLRKNSAFSAILIHNHRALFEKSLETGLPGIFECSPGHGVSHALTAKLSSQNTVVFINVCSVLLREVMQQSTIQTELDVFSINKRIIEHYTDICKKFNNEIPSDISEILHNNSLRFSRAAYHFSVYANTLTKTTDFEPEEICDIISLCTEILNYFRAKISPLGYRIGLNIEKTLGVTTISKRAFLNVLLELVAVSLRISDTKSVAVNLCESAGQLIFRFELNTIDFNACKIAYATEFDFISTACRYFGWEFTPLLSNDGQTSMMTFSVPVKSGKGTVSAADITNYSNKNSLFEIADQIFTVFYFNENI